MEAKTIRWLVRIAFLLFLVIAIMAIGNKIGMDRSARKYRPQIESYQAQIDSLRFSLDTLLASIDPEFANKQKVIVKTKIKYIIQKQEDEKQEYFMLDTTGRVSYFRQRIRERMARKPAPVSDEFWIEGGVDEPLNN